MCIHIFYKIYTKLKLNFFSINFLNKICSVYFKFLFCVNIVFILILPNFFFISNVINKISSTVYDFDR